MGSWEIGRLALAKVWGDCGGRGGCAAACVGHKSQQQDIYAQVQQQGSFDMEACGSSDAEHCCCSILPPAVLCCVQLCHQEEGRAGARCQGQPVNACTGNQLSCTGSRHSSCRGKQCSCRCSESSCKCSRCCCQLSRCCCDGCRLGLGSLGAAACAGSCRVGPDVREGHGRPCVTSLITRIWYFH